MTRNQIDALRNQEAERHNQVTEQMDRIWRPVEAVSGAIGSLGSLAKGVGAWTRPLQSHVFKDRRGHTNKHFHDENNKGGK